MCPIILRNCEGLWNNPFSPCKIIRRKQNGLVLKTKSKQITEIENREEREIYLGLPGRPSGQPSPLAWCQSSLTSASRQRRDSARAREAPRLLLLAAEPLDAWVNAPALS